MIEYSIAKIPCKMAKDYIIEHHYSHGCHASPSPCYGLFDGGGVNRSSYVRYTV